MTPKLVLFTMYSVIRKKKIPPLLKTWQFLSISFKLKMRVHSVPAWHNAICFQVTSRTSYSLPPSHNDLFAIPQVPAPCCQLRALVVVLLSFLSMLASTHIFQACSDFTSLRSILSLFCYTLQMQPSTSCLLPSQFLLPLCFPSFFYP